jgi:hypothetical protein
VNTVLKIGDTDVCGAVATLARYESSTGEVKYAGAIYAAGFFPDYQAPVSADYPTDPSLRFGHFLIGITEFEPGTLVLFDIIQGTYGAVATNVREI